MHVPQRRQEFIRDAGARPQLRPTEPRGFASALKSESPALGWGARVRAASSNTRAQDPPVSRGWTLGQRREDCWTPGAPSLVPGQKAAEIPPSACGTDSGGGALPLPGAEPQPGGCAADHPKTAGSQSPPSVPGGGITSSQTRSMTSARACKWSQGWHRPRCP